MSVMTPTLFYVFMAALATALATGIGALPFIFCQCEKIKLSLLGYANALAAGLMLAASFGLVFEGYDESASSTLLGMVLGVAFIAIGHHFLDKHDDVHIDQIEGVNAKKSILIIATMTIHSMAEGIGVGVAFGSGQELGHYITLAIAIHNIPEGLAIALVTVPKGMKVWKAVWWSVFSSLPQPLLAIPAFLFVQTFTPFIPIGMGLAAGAMIWMVFAEILPDSFKDTGSEKVSVVTALSLIVMLAIQAVLLPV
jgi:zinc transporter ZupT